MTLLQTLDSVVRGALTWRGVESRYIDTPIGKVHLYDAKGTGTLPTLLILHGIGACATNYAPVIQGLRRHFSRIIAPDAPGHGFSDQPERALSTDALFNLLANALDKELPDGAIVFGNSLGGGMAIRYGIEHPGKTRALILSSPAGAQMPAEDWQALLTSFQFKSNDDAHRFAQRLYHRAPWYLSLAAPSIREVFDRPAVRDFLLGVTEKDLFSPEQLAKLTMPVLFLWGKSEKLMPASNLGYFRQHLPGHVLVEEPEDFGHCPYLDRPGKLAKRIAEFARSLQPA